MMSLPFFSSVLVFKGYNQFLDEDIYYLYTLDVFFIKEMRGIASGNPFQLSARNSGHRAQVAKVYNHRVLTQP